MTESSKSNYISINQTIKQLFSEPEWTLKIGTGCLINGAAWGLLLVNIGFLPISFCLWSCASGYILMTAASKFNDPGSKLPAWSNILELMTGGGIWIALCLAHFALLPVVLSGCLLFGEMSGLDNVANNGFIPWAAVSWSMVAILMPVISLFSLYLMINFAIKQESKSAFALKDVFRRLCRQPRLLAQAWLIQTGLVFLAVILPILTLLGVCLVPSTLFVAQLIGSCLAVNAWRASA